MRNFTLGLILGLTLGGTAYAFLDDEDFKRPSARERLERDLDDYWFYKSFEKGFNQFGDRRNPC